MTIPENPSELFSPFLPSTYNIPEDPEGLNQFFGSTLSDFSDVVNDKKIGQYIDSNSLQNGEEWWYKSTKINRNGFQAMAFIPSFPNAGVLTLTLTSDPRFPINNINEEFVVTHTWGDASRPCTNPDNTVSGTGDYFSFFSQGDSRISYTMSNKQIVITTTVDMTAYSGFIVVEFLRRGT